MCRKIRYNRESWKFLGTKQGLNICNQTWPKALFSSPQKLKTFQDFPSRRILGHMHEALDIYENKN